MRFESNFQLFQCLALGLGYEGVDQDRAEQADPTVEEKCGGHAGEAQEHRKAVGKHERRGPEGGDSYRNTGAPQSIGKNLGDQNPGYRSKGYRVESNGAESKHQYKYALQMGTIGKPRHEMRATDSTTAKEQERSSAEAVNEHHGEKSEDEIDRSGHDDVEHHCAHAVTCAAIDLFRVVEKNIDSAPLLQHCQTGPDANDTPQAGSEQLAP